MVEWPLNSEERVVHIFKVFSNIWPLWKWLGCGGILLWRLHICWNGELWRVCLLPRKLWNSHEAWAQIYHNMTILGHLPQPVCLKNFFYFELVPAGDQLASAFESVFLSKGYLFGKAILWRKDSLWHKMLFNGISICKFLSTYIIEGCHFGKVFCEKGSLWD